MAEGAHERVRLRIVGRVQGVGYRYSTVEAARRNQLTGWVRNTHDGAVECVAEGPSEAVAAFVRWCHDGPPGARVQQVRQEDEPATGEFPDFKIIR